MVLWPSCKLLQHNYYNENFRAHSTKSSPEMAKPQIEEMRGRINLLMMAEEVGVSGSWCAAM